MKIELKKCTDCKKELPATEDYFYKQKKTNKRLEIFYTLTSMCKDCVSRRSREYQKNNKGKRREYDKQKYIKNRDYIILRNRQYEKNNPEYAKNKLRKWQKNNRDKIKIYNQMQRSRSHDISESEWESCKAYFNNSCAYCGISEKDATETYNNRLHKEHIDCEGANDISNCVPACKHCNSSKWIYPLHEWYTESNESYTTDRYDRIIKWLNEDHLKFLEVNI
jgi:hypothetical protein